MYDIRKLKNKNINLKFRIRNLVANKIPSHDQKRKHGEINRKRNSMEKETQSL